MAKGPVKEKIKGLRQRQKSDGSWRIWWEPSAAERNAGIKPVDLKTDRLTWSTREAKRLNDEAASLITGGPKRTAFGGRSMAALIADYKQSPSFKRLRAKTKEGYISNLNIIQEKWGPQAVSEFSKPVMYQWYRTLYETSGKWQSVALIRMCSILFSHSELLGWRDEGSNPCLRLKMERPGMRKRIATWPEIIACFKAAITCDLAPINLALHLAVFHGQRQTDILSATPEDFQEEPVALGGNSEPTTMLVWRFRRSKRQNIGAVVIHPEAQDLVQAALVEAHKGPGPLVWDRRTGKAYSKELFFKRWEQVRTTAAKSQPTVADLQWRDFRRTFGNLARRNAELGDVADVLGNTSDTNIELRETYMAPQIATSARAILSIKKPGQDDDT